MSKKDDIIHTALYLFNSHSYNSIGVDRIISESGVAKMTFYKYFPSKAKLIEECLHRRNMNIQDSLGAAIAQCEKDDYLGHIKTIFFGIRLGFIWTILTAVCFKKQLRKYLKFIHPPCSLRQNTKNGYWNEFVLP